MSGTVDEIRFLEPYRFRSAAPLLIDVGAHHGYVSLAFAKKGWRIVAFEPERVNRAKFAATLEGYPNIECIARAVSNVSGDKVPFYVSEEHYGIHSLKPWHATHRAAYEVETVKLDEIMAERGLEHVTFLKIDVEGADFLALQGLDVGRYRPELVMTEFMDERTKPTFGYVYHDVVSYMNARGYAAFVSEWTPVSDYAREGVVTAPTTNWLRCARYPLDHEPAWGNLFFVPEGEADRFGAALAVGIRRELSRLRLRELAKRIPGVHSSYRLLTSALRTLRGRAS
jgi:FkbM family methyltransferase